MATVLTGGAPVAAQPLTRAVEQPAAVLTVISGDVMMRSTTPDFAPAVDGTVLFAGDTVRTGVDARAVLTLFEGSTVELEPVSEVTVAAAAARGGGTIVDLVQSAGRSWHVVTRLTTVDSRYEVRTPSATASVRGTAFEVAVVDDPVAGVVTTVTTTEGRVTAADIAGTSEVLVAADQTTTVRAKGAPESPRTAAEAQRVVTVTAPSTTSLVVDPLGRSNGLKDGRVIAQTPGARVAVVNGTVVVTLPNLPEGPITTTVAPDATSSMTVSTTVADRGKRPVTVHREVRSGSPSATTGVDVRSSVGGDVQVRPLTREETEERPGAKVGSKKSPRATSASTDRPVAKWKSTSGQERRDGERSTITRRPSTSPRPSATPGPAPKEGGSN